MGVFAGAMTVRRYRVEGEVPEDFRDLFMASLQEHAFREPKNPAPGEEHVGWCLIQNLLDLDFSERDKWLFNHYLTVALRVDKRALPAKLFKAHLEKRVAAWLAENGRQRAPAAVKAEIKQALEIEMLAKTLPRVATYEFCWNIVDGWVAFHATGEGPNDLFRKLFRQTFGCVLTPCSPLDLLIEEPAVLEGMEMAGISDYRPRGEGARA
ncbi:MAG: hypothetical protein RL071_937 [Pseudomonadota bacterium]|jgi:DNA recombination-dependent growth factor C